MFPLLSIGTGLSGFEKGYQDAQQNALQRAMQRQQMQQYEQQQAELARQQQARQALGNLLSGGGASIQPFNPNAMGGGGMQPPGQFGGGLLGLLSKFGIGGNQQQQPMPYGPSAGGFAGPPPPMPGASSQPSMPPQGGAQPGYAPPLPSAPPMPRHPGGMTEQQIIQRESGGKPFVGWGGTGKPPIDLSNAPLDPQGYPTTPARPGPQGPSTAGGLYGITKTNWDAESPEVAKTIGHTPQFTNTQDQRAVYQAMRAKYGDKPWTVWSGQTGGQSKIQGAGGEGGAAPPAMPPPPKGYDLSQLAQQLKAANPGLDGATIFDAVEQYAGLMDKQSQRDWETYKFQVGEQDKAEDRKALGDYRRDMMGQRGWQPMTDPTNNNMPYRFNLGTGEAFDFQGNPYVPGGAQKLGGGGATGGRASKNIIVTDAKGNEVFRGSAHQTGQGWVNDADQKPIQAPEGGKIELSGTESGGGGRAGAQVLRQEIGGREVLSDLQNAVSMPVGANTGILGQYHPGTSLMGALGGDVARELTPQDAQLMQASFASLTRELSILMSPVYGGSWAADQINPLIPKEGDTVGTTLFKMARIAQSADNALEAIGKSPILSGEQKEFANSLRQEIQAAVPWTSAQAMAFARGGHPDQSFADFMKGNPQGDGSAQTGAPTATNDKGETVEWNGTAWVPKKK